MHKTEGWESQRFSINGEDDPWNWAFHPIGTMAGDLTTSQQYRPSFDPQSRDCREGGTLRFRFCVVDDQIETGWRTVAEVLGYNLE